MSTDAPPKKGSVRVLVEGVRCKVCNGPARVPSTLELVQIDGAVEQAEDLYAEQRQTMLEMLHAGQAVGTHEIERQLERVADAARLDGEQKARSGLIYRPGDDPED